MRRKEAGHYLRSPLTVVKGMLELVLRRWDSLDDEQRRDYVRKALDATNRVVVAIEVVEAKILHNENITVVLEDANASRRKEEDSEVQNHRVI
ncbi:MAG: histidine kinase dimerization/phospho-acceptor domain-containing protein [Actinomycetota bacterium]